MIFPRKSLSKVAAAAALQLLHAATLVDLDNDFLRKNILFNVFRKRLHNSQNKLARGATRQVLQL
jgi:hypothetical protein